MTLFDANVVISPSDVKFGEHMGVFYLSDQLCDERERVSISDSVLVQASIILDRAQLFVLFPNEEEWRCVWRFVWTDISFSDLFLDPFSETFVLLGRDRINFAVNCFWGTFF